MNLKGAFDVTTDYPLMMRFSVGIGGGWTGWTVRRDAEAALRKLVFFRTMRDNRPARPLDPAVLACSFDALTAFGCGIGGWFVPQPYRDESLRLLEELAAVRKILLVQEPARCRNRCPGCPPT